MVRFPKNLKLTANIQRSFQYSHNVSQKCQARFQAIWAVDFEKQSKDKIGILYYCEPRGRLFQVHVLFCNPSDLQIIVRDAVKKKTGLCGKKSQTGGGGGSDPNPFVDVYLPS